MSGFATELWRVLVQDSPLAYPQLFLAVSATLMLWPGDLFVPAGKKGRWADVTLGLLFATLVLVLGNGISMRSGFAEMFRVDGITVGFQILCILSAMLTVLLSQPQLEALKEQSVEYYALILYSLVGMLFLVGATDLISIFFSVELMALCIYVLVGYLRHRDRSVEGAMKYFLLGAFSSGILLFGISLLFAATGGISTNLEVLGRALPLATPGQGLLVGAGVILVLAGFAFKVAAVPFHMWSPDAYEGAPTPITAFMSVAPKAAALAAFIRLFGHGLAGLHAEWSVPLGWIAAASMVVGNLAALRQQSLKRMLAYSSIAHVGYLLLGVLSHDAQAGVQAVWLYLLIYLVMQTGAFAVVILLEGRSEGERIDDFRGLGKRQPVLAFAMLVFLLSLAGIPPLVGFFGKFYLFKLAIEQGYVALTVLALLTSAVSAYYYLGVVQVMYFKEPRGERAEEEPHSLGYVIGLFALLTLVGTLFGTRLLDWVARITWA